MLFENRREAGRLLAAKLAEFADRNDVVVLALPRGGVPVGYEVARALKAPLDIFVVRKLGAPGQPELAMGAIASGGVRVLNETVVNGLGISEQTIVAAAQKEQSELERREAEYREGRLAVDVRGKVVILVDDGLATGSSMRVAARALQKKEPAKIIVAVPVAAPSTCADFEAEVEQVVCAATPQPFWAVGQWYKDFSQTSDEEVRTLLKQAALEFGTSDSRGCVIPLRATERKPVEIPVNRVMLDADLVLPAGTTAIVVFAHGSGSSRHSPRNRHVARILQEAGLGTLLVDLLTPTEEWLDSQNAELRFDIALLSRRIVAVTEWLGQQRQTASLAVGYFGASTGAAAALAAAADLGDRIGAVVSRGGRPDLAGQALRRVHSPTLLIVGGSDSSVLALNRQARQQLLSETRLEIIPGASHLFDEPGALDQVALLTREWFVEHLQSRKQHAPAA